MLLELNQDQLSVLKRALEARARDMQLRLGSDPGDEGFRREATLSTHFCDRSRPSNGKLAIALGVFWSQGSCRMMTSAEPQHVISPVDRRPSACSMQSGVRQHAPLAGTLEARSLDHSGASLLRLFGP